MADGKANGSDAKSDDPGILSGSGGARIAYHRTRAPSGGGNRPGLVFLGGFKSDMTGTKAVALEAHARSRSLDFLRFDYQGHGDSSGDFEEGCIGTWYQDALDAIDGLTEGPLILIGSSMGGWIALLAALARPDRIAGLVGIAAAPDFTQSMWQGFDAEARRQVEQEGRYAMPSEYDSEEPYIITRKLIEDGRNHFLLAGPIAIRCPVRLLQGMEDTAVPWETALRIAERLESQDVEITLVKGGDHRLSGPADLDRLFGTIDALIAAAE